MVGLGIFGNNLGKLLRKDKCTKTDEKVNVTNVLLLLKYNSKYYLEGAENAFKDVTVKSLFPLEGCMFSVGRFSPPKTPAFTPSYCLRLKIITPEIRDLRKKQVPMLMFWKFLFICIDSSMVFVNKTLVN